MPYEEKKGRELPWQTGKEEPDWMFETPESPWQKTLIHS